MNIQFVEAFWRNDGDGEYSARYTAKSFWSGFGDAWCWENDAVPLCVTLATIDAADSLASQFALFCSNPGSGIMILGAHGRDPEEGHRHLLIRNNQGQVTPLGWADIRAMLASAGGAPLHNKVLIIDSCSFCADAEEAQKTVAEAQIGMLCGFDRDIEPIDSMVLEVALVSYLLWEWWDGERAFDPDFLRAAENPFGENFLQRYESLSRALGLRAWRWKDKRAEEIVIKTLPLQER